MTTLGNQVPSSEIHTWFKILRVVAQLQDECGGLTFLFLNPCEIWLHYLATSLSTPFFLSFSSFLPSFPVLFN